MGETVEFSWVPPELIDDLWLDLEPFVELPLKKTGADKYYLPEDVKERVKDGRMLCWAALDDEIIGCAITQIITFPRRKVLDVPFVGGRKFHKWGAFEVLKKYAKTEGCDGLRGFGREGWPRMLGIEPEYTYIWDLDL